jgi:5-methyltetrahydrofolate--homocysteine methyltransferase
VRERVEAWKHEGEYLKSHAFAALALETAEASAEWLHRKLRGDWGFPDGSEIAPEDRFAARYRGKRYSYYLACPDLAGQRVSSPRLRLRRSGPS